MIKMGWNVGVMEVQSPLILETIQKPNEPISRWKNNGYNTSYFRAWSLFAPANQNRKQTWTPLPFTQFLLLSKLMIFVRLLRNLEHAILSWSDSDMSDDNIETTLEESEKSSTSFWRVKRKMDRGKKTKTENAKKWRRRCGTLWWWRPHMMRSDIPINELWAARIVMSPGY